jgi:hypothetical protein
MSLESFPQPTPPQEKQEPAVEKLETSKKVFEFLDRTKFLDIRKSDEQFDEWLQKLSYEDYTNYLTRLNGILREVPIKKRAIDGGNVELSSQRGDVSHAEYLPPSVEQKSDMMKEIFGALKQISNNEDRALLIYYALQAIHPYSDGNGRTGRLLHELISENGKQLTQASLSELLDHDSKGHEGTGEGRQVFSNKVLEPEEAYLYINHELTRDFLGKDFPNEYGSITALVGKGGQAVLPESLKKQLSLQESILTEKILGESNVRYFPFSGIVLMKLLGQNQELQKYQSEGNLRLTNAEISEDNGKKCIFVNAIKMYSDFTSDHVKQLFEIHKEVKSKFIQTMIDIFTNPENHQVKTKKGEKVPIKNMFRN